MNQNRTTGNGPSRTWRAGMRFTPAVLVVAVVGIVVWANAGDLNPPAGAIAPTQRTPISSTTTPGGTLSLYKITAPGSYYLTGNITGVSGKNGIEIAASGVTLDLMGFDLVGVAGSFSGVRTSNTLNNIAVLNGSVRNWGGSGVYFEGNHNRFADLRVSGCVASGILNTGSIAVITNCSAVSNGYVGIESQQWGATITNCSASSNGGPYGIIAGTGGVITNCSASNNAAAGFYIGSHGTIAHCSAAGNTTNGIKATFGVTITDCSVGSNHGDGIEVDNDSVVVSNTCASNGDGGDGAGIHVTGNDNRIEGNNCTSADRGIDVDGTGNFITRNSASGNTTNWDVVAGNVILVVNATPAGAFTGNSGGVAPGSTDPNANFTY